MKCRHVCVCFLCTGREATKKYFVSFVVVLVVAGGRAQTTSELKTGA